MSTTPYTIDTAYEAIREYFSRPDAVLAKSNGVGCWYRHPSGAKCAVGCLIPDELYSAAMESSTIDLVVERFPLDHLFPDEELVRFLEQAQSRHDVPTTTTVEEFISKLDALYQEWVGVEE